MPVIVLTTEADDAEAWSKNNGGAPFNHICDLVLEVAMNAVATDDAGDPVAGNGGNVIGSPVTDRDLNARLDLIEERAVDVITVGETSQARLLHTAVIRRVPIVIGAAIDQGKRSNFSDPIPGWVRPFAVRPDVARPVMTIQIILK